MLFSALDRDDREKNPSEQTSFFERVRAEIYGHADFFPANPATLAADPPETNYYTVVFKANPPKEMVEFRDALFKVFPHTNQVRGTCLKSKSLMLWKAIRYFATIIMKGISTIICALLNMYFE